MKSTEVRFSDPVSWGCQWAPPSVVDRMTLRPTAHPVAAEVNCSPVSVPAGTDAAGEPAQDAAGGAGDAGPAVPVEAGGGPVEAGPAGVPAAADDVPAEDLSGLAVPPAAGDAAVPQAAAVSATAAVSA